MKISRRQLKNLIKENLFDDISDFASSTYDSVFGDDSYEEGDIIEDYDDWGIYKEENGKWLYKKKGEEDKPWRRLPASAAANLNKKYKSDTAKEKEDEKSTNTTSNEPKIEYYSRLPEIEIKKFLPSLLRGRDAKVSETDAEGCAQWVNRQTGSTKGNAWHMHNISEKSSFRGLDTEVGEKLASIFTKINKSPKSVDRFKDSIRNIVKTLVPDQKQFSNLELGDIVGLFHYSSTYHAKAFFEAASGTTSMGTGSDVSPGSVFENQEGKSWQKEMLGSDFIFKPSRKFYQSGLGLNTHVGIVGAKINGEPIIFHNIDGNIHATPLSALSPRPGRDAIVWTAPGETISRKVVRLGRALEKYLS